MNRRDKERLMKQIDREIDVENTKGALLGFGLGLIYTRHDRLLHCSGVLI